MIKKTDKIYVAGHNGLVGSSIIRELKKQGYKNVIYKSRHQLNLINQSRVYKFLKKEKPKFVFIAAAKVGGILTNNSLRGQFIFENLAIQNNLIDGSFQTGIKDLILGSNCVYQKIVHNQLKKNTY